MTLNYLTYLLSVMFFSVFLLTGNNNLDDEEFRNFVVWLEDQRIRLYKIEDRVELRNVKSSEWLKTFRKVSVNSTPL